MLTTNYILNDITPLTLKNSVSDAKKMFQNSIFSHALIVEENHYIGLLSEADLSSLEDNKASLKDVRYLFQSFFTFNDIGWLDLLHKFAVNDCNILPILNKEKKYCGYFDLSDVLHYFSNTPFLQEESTTLIISKNKNEYALSEIAQIIESNNAKLFGLFLSASNGNNTEITIKLYSENINDVIHSFRRYNYSIIKGIKEDEYLDDLKERSDYFQKYLNI
ncbi:MAG: CBS domain-containing protein [Flavobacteriaceae bacterium]